MHFSQGWVQFGYRFSNDVVPFALVLVAIGFSWLVDRAVAARPGRCRWRWASSSCRCDQRVGRHLGPASSDGERGSPGGGCPPLVVGIVAFIAARLAMLPGVGFWDTAELQTVAPVLGTAHPTGFPTYVLLGLGRERAARRPFGDPAFRMNLFAGLCVAVAAAVTVDLVRALTRSALLGVMAGLGLALTGIVWKIGTQAEAHALHLALVADPVPAAGGLGGRPAGPDARRGGDRLRAGGRQPLADAACSPRRSPSMSLAVDPRDPAPAAPHRSAASVAAVLTVALVYLELPLRAGPFPAPLVYGRPDTWDGFWYIALAEQFRGSLVGPFDDLPGEGWRPRRSGPSTPSGRWPSSCRSRSSVTALRAAALRAADGLGGRAHVLLRRVVRQRR